MSIELRKRLKYRAVNVNLLELGWCPYVENKRVCLLLSGGAWGDSFDY
jgi:hypothetical protein